MSSICHLRPEYPAEDAHRFFEKEPGWFECEYCRQPREDMMCFCAATLAVPGTAKHTVAEHWDNSCRGFGSWSGPCGGCYECLGAQATYGKDEDFFIRMAEQEKTLRANELKVGKEQ